MSCSETITMTSRNTLDKSIELLTSVDVADAPFLSCYLDLEAGVESCQVFLTSEAEVIRAGLSDMQRIDFDEAFEKLEEAIASVSLSGSDQGPTAGYRSHGSGMSGSCGHLC